MNENDSLKFNLKEDDILYYLHIPKTAGTTLIESLKKHFPSDSILEPQSWKQLSHNMPNDFSNFRLVKGHFGYAVYRILPKKPVYITVLREPEEVVISHLKMLRRQQTPRRRFNISENDTISELILRPVIKGLLNPQAHWLVADLDVISLTKGLDLKLLDKFLLEDQAEFMLSHISDKKLLEIAKERLSKFAFVGIVERFEESLFLLHYIMGWRPIRNIVQLNPTPTKIEEELSKEAINLLKERTKVDKELYKFAEQIFENRFSQMVKELKEKHYESRFDNMAKSDVVYEMLKKHYIENFGRKEFLIQDYESKYFRARTKIGSCLRTIKKGFIKSNKV